MIGIDDILKPLESTADALFESGWIGILGIIVLIVAGLYLVFRMVF